MSNSYRAKKSGVQDQQLKVQKLTVDADDTHIYDPNSGNGKFTIGEEVTKVRLVIQHDDSVPSLVTFAASAIAISGSDNDEIVVTGLALAADDQAIIEYETAQ